MIMDITSEGIEDMYKKFCLKMVKLNTYIFDVEYLVNQFLIEFPGLAFNKNILTSLIKLTHENDDIIVIDISNNPFKDGPKLEMRYKVKPFSNNSNYKIVDTSFPNNSNFNIEDYSISKVDSNFNIEDYSISDVD